jgi:hypothetical protein
VHSDQVGRVLDAGDRLRRIRDHCVPALCVTTLVGGRTLEPGLLSGAPPRRRQRGRTGRECGGAPVVGTRGTVCRRASTSVSPSCPLVSEPISSRSSRSIPSRRSSRSTFVGSWPRSRLRVSLQRASRRSGSSSARCWSWPEARARSRRTRAMASGFRVRSRPSRSSCRPNRLRRWRG